MLVTFVVCCISCTPTYVMVQIKRAEPTTTKVVKIFHADKNQFNVSERGLINDAIAKINDQTNGLAKIGVIYDLDWSAPTANADYVHLDQILSHYSFSSAVAKQDKDMPLGNVVLGWADVDFNNPKYVTRVNLVVDRLRTDEQYRHVVMHEILHALRLHHTPGKKISVMYWQTTGPEPTTCMSFFDAQELCRVYNCKVEEISYCERK